MEDKPLVTPLNPKTLTPSESELTPPTSSQAGKFFIIITVIIAGVVTGFVLSRRGSMGDAAKNTSAGKNIINTSTEVGSTDTNTFKDTATGELQAGGIRGEGTHKLVREGGPSQTVYVVSSVVDLDSYVGKKVQVWGQTLKAKYAGWLMDVGRLKILE